MSALALLERTDKWFVGSGDGLVWAPPFPAWHDTPGFWDEAHLVQYPVGPLFTLSFIEGGVPLPLPRAASRSWNPARLELTYRLRPGLAAVETRTAPGGRILASTWKLPNSGKHPVVLDVVLWTAVPGEEVESDGVVAARDGVRLIRPVRDRKGQALSLALVYRLSGFSSWSAVRSEASGPNPDFRLTPFYDRWTAEGRLGGRAELDGISSRGLVYLALARRIRIAPGGHTGFTGSVAVTPQTVAAPAGSPRRQGPPVAGALRNWSRWERSLPAFSCSDRRYSRYWSYRWYGLRLNRLPAGLGQYPAPTVAEGIAYFHQPISYSAMCHARELRWANEPAWARGVVETFFSRQASDGSIPGRVYLDHLVEPDFYHADWGGAVEDILAVTPDQPWLGTIYPALARYAEWILETRDREGSGMIDVVDQFEAGQEYMSRYQAVDPEADRYGWENRIRLKGIDVTVYAYRLFRFLERRAPDPGAKTRWAERAERTRRAVRDRMWDPATGFFSDVNPATGQRTGVKAAACFYPWMCDLTDATHADGLAAHLFNEREFWTPYPVPSSSVDDPLFDPDASWKGKRHVCPWNGRVWPMTNSHVIDALARVTREHRAEWAPRVVELISRFIEMLCFDGDPRRPNCFEHYHPYSGKGSVYRGIDDYQHSWINDLLVRHLAGVLPRGERGFLLDPFPFGVGASLRNVRIAGHRVDVTIAGKQAVARVNGRIAARTRIGIPVEVSW